MVLMQGDRWGKFGLLTQEARGQVSSLRPSQRDESKAKGHGIGRVSLAPYYEAGKRET